MKFSVVIPIHNKLPHLERSINSVLNQTYQNFEVLLIDDASTDGSSDKIKEFTDPRISIYIRTEPGPGGYAARNLGIKKAAGEWIAFLDADDVWYPNHLEKMNQLSLKFPSSKFLSCGWEIQKKSIKKECIFFRKYKDAPSQMNLRKYLRHILINENSIWTSVVCIKKDSLDDDHFFPSNENAKRGGDSFAWLRLFCNKKIDLYWSNHIGGIYYLDTVNQVTKNTTGEFKLFNRDTYLRLSNSLDNDEKKLLKKYFNLKIVQNWILDIEEKEAGVTLRKNMLKGAKSMTYFTFYALSFFSKKLHPKSRYFFRKINVWI